MQKTKHFLLLAALLLGSLTASAHDFEVNGIYYQITSSSNLTVAVTYKGDNWNNYSEEDKYIGNISIPQYVTYDNVTYQVTSVADYAFYYCTKLTHIILPEGIADIGYMSFYRCDSLTSIIIPEGVVSLGSWAFGECANLKSVTLPSSLSEFGYYPVFQCCNSLDYIVCYAENPPTASGMAPFYGVDKSIPLYVPAGSVEAYKSAQYWSEFTNIQAIPSSDIASGTCGDNLTWRLTEEGELIIEGTGDMYDYSSESAPWYEYRISVKTITIEEGVTSIGEEAFYECNSLTSIAIPEGVTSIGDRAFYECNKLVSITIPEGMKEIGYMAFAVCNLIRITIPSSISTIGIGAFGNNPNLEEIVVNQGNACYDSRNNCNAIIETNSNTLMAGCASTLIPEGVTAIGDYAFAFCSSTSIAIPEGVTTIGEWAFCCCRNLTSIVLPGSLTSIGHNAFYDCSSLTSINLPESVTSIGWYAFAGCSSLTSISIPENVAEIGHGAFIACNNLTSITCHAVMPPTIYSATFSGVSKSIPVYVPAGSVDAYQSAAYWSEFTNILALPTYVDGIALSQSEAMLTEGETVTLTATAMPDDATDKTLIWSSSDERVATVDASGLVTALTPGTATITVTANDGSGMSASCVVTVKVKPTVRCAAPVIDYVDGQVVLTCETEGVEFVTDVVAEGAQRYQTSAFDLAAVYTITAYATKEGYADSETTTVTLCWVECNEKHEDLDGPNTKIEIPSCPVLILTDGGVITLTGLADGTAVAVCNLKGVELGTATAVNGTATITTGLTVGNTVIVKIGGRSVKVVIHE